MLDQTSYMTWKGSKTAKQNILRLHGMSARCRPDVGQHSHVTCSQHVGLHVGPAKVILNTMLQVCTPRVGWMSASVGHEIFSAATFLLCADRNPTMRSMSQCGGHHLPLLTKPHKTKSMRQQRETTFSKKKLLSFNLR